MTLYRIGLAVVLGVIALAIEREGRADLKTSCIDAHADGQELRLAGHWRAARERFQTCTRSACPGPIAEECVRLYEQLEAEMPTLLVRATQPDGADTIDGSLTIDGVSVAGPLPSTALPIDPGPHRVRIDHPGWISAEAMVVVREGEKEHPLALHFDAPTPRSRWFGFAMLGVAVGTAAVGVPFAVVGKVHEDNLAGSPCGKTGTCAPNEVDAVRLDYWTAGIAAGIGIVSLGIGIWDLVARPSPARTAVVPGGIRLTF